MATGVLESFVAGLASKIVFLGEKRFVARELRDVLMIFPLFLDIFCTLYSGVDSFVALWSA